MVSGRRAFQGDSQASLIAAILTKEPEPVSAIEPMTSPALERLVRKCLAKNLDGRWQTARDVADELRWLSSGAGTAPASSTPKPQTWRRRSIRGAAVVLMLTAVGGVAWRVAHRGSIG